MAASKARKGAGAGPGVDPVGPGDPPVLGGETWIGLARPSALQAA